MNANAVNVGEVIGGRLRVERQLGAGGMGVVVAAQHLGLQRQVAVKLIRPAFKTDRELVARFLREARMMSRLRSPYVTRVLDTGRDEAHGPYIVMEYLDGVDLECAVARRGPMGVPEAVGTILQACVGLAEAHACGLVHRDLKPSNLFLAKSWDGAERVKIIDFGMVKTMDIDLSEPSMSGRLCAQMLRTAQDIIMGSPAFMPPEQIRNPATVDERADVWALGATLFYLLTARLPFEASSLAEACAKVCHEQPADFDVGIPPGLRAVVLRCLAKAADDRIASAQDLVTALEPFAPAGCLVTRDVVAHMVRRCKPQRTPRSSQTLLGIGHLPHLFISAR